MRGASDAGGARDRSRRAGKRKEGPTARTAHGGTRGDKVLKVKVSHPTEFYSSVVCLIHAFKSSESELQ